MMLTVREVREVLERLAEADGTPEQVEQRLDVLFALARLPAPYRLALLYRAAGFTPKEVGQHLGYKKPHQLLANAERKLLDELQDKEREG